MCKKAWASSGVVKGDEHTVEGEQCNRKSSLVRTILPMVALILGQMLGAQGFQFLLHAIALGALSAPDRQVGGHGRV